MSRIKQYLLIISISFITMCLAITGCQGPNNQTAIRLMQVLPYETETLFFLDSRGISAVPDLQALWESIAWVVLPPESEPVHMGIILQEGEQRCVVFTFGDGKGPALPSGEVESREYRGHKITITDGNLEAFTLVGLRFISLPDYSNGVIDAFIDNTGSMNANPTFDKVLNRSYFGLFHIIGQKLSIDGSDSAVGLEFNFNKDLTEHLLMSGAFDFFSSENASLRHDALNDFLINQCNVESLVSKQKGTMIEVTGHVGVAHFNSFVDGWLSKSDQ